MSRRHRIAAALTTLAVATALSLAASGTASAQDESPLITAPPEEDSIVLVPQLTLEDLMGPDGEADPDTVDWEAVEDAQEDAAEEAQENVAEQAADLDGLYQVDWNELDDPDPDTSGSLWQVDW